MKELYRQAFNAIKDNNLELFKAMISNLDFDLLITDHCHEALESDLGGTWKEKSGRWENNTLLNLALSLERLDFVEELIIQNQAGRDIGLTIANVSCISPVHMMLMVGCNKSGDDRELRIKQLRWILPFIWRAASIVDKYQQIDLNIGSAISKIYHLPAVVVMDLLDLCQEDLVVRPEIKVHIKSAIQDMLRMSLNQYAADNQKENIYTFILLMKKSLQYSTLLDEILMDPQPGHKAPFICALLDRMYRPVPYKQERSYIPKNKYTLALITPAIYKNKDVLENITGQKLVTLLSSNFKDHDRSNDASTASSVFSFFSKFLVKQHQSNDESSAKPKSS